MDYVALPSELTLNLGPDGRRDGGIEFLVYVFDVDGRLLNATGKTISLNLRPTTYARLMKSMIKCHLEISAPSQIETFLRVGVRDVSTNHFGVIEVLTAIVNHLAPVVYQTSPEAAAPLSISTEAPSN